MVQILPSIADDLAPSIASLGETIMTFIDPEYKTKLAIQRKLATDPAYRQQMADQNYLDGVAPADNQFLGQKGKMILAATNPSEAAIRGKQTRSATQEYGGDKKLNYIAWVKKNLGITPNQMRLEDLNVEQANRLAEFQRAQPGLTTEMLFRQTTGQSQTEFNANRAKNEITGTVDTYLKDHPVWDAREIVRGLRDGTISGELYSGLASDPRTREAIQTALNMDKQDIDDERLDARLGTQERIAGKRIAAKQGEDKIDAELNLVMRGYNAINQAGGDFNAYRYLMLGADGDRDAGTKRLQYLLQNPDAIGTQRYDRALIAIHKAQGTIAAEPENKQVLKLRNQLKGLNQALTPKGKDRVMPTAEVQASLRGQINETERELQAIVGGPLYQMMEVETPTEVDRSRLIPGTTKGTRKEWKRVDMSTGAPAPEEQSANSQAGASSETRANQQVQQGGGAAPALDTRLQTWAATLNKMPANQRMAKLKQIEASNPEIAAQLRTRLGVK